MIEINVRYFDQAGDYRQICELYWDCDDSSKFTYTVNEIAETFGVSSRDVQKIISEYCEAYTTEVNCVQCESPYTFKNRTDFHSRLPYRQWTCPSCIVAEKEAKLRQVELEQERLRNIIRREFNSLHYDPIVVENLIFEDAVYLYTFMRLGLMEDFLHIKPYSLCRAKLTPHHDFDHEILSHFYKRHLLCIHPESNLEAFKFDNNTLTSFITNDVAWIVPKGNLYPDTRTATKTVWNELERIFSTMEWPQHWQNNWQELQVKIAIYECLEYLTLVLEEHDLPFNPGAKTFAMLDQLLGTYSVAQMYNFIWRAGRDAAAFYMRCGVAKQHAANTVVGNIQKQAERAQIENWEIKPFNRNYNLPQTSISEVLYNAVLQIGDEGFKLPPK